jgi:hypothetical protein
MLNPIARLRRGHDAASARIAELRRAEGPQPARAVAEALSAARALSETGAWPGPRDPASERSVEEVRSRWACIERRAQAQQGR